MYQIKCILIKDGEIFDVVKFENGSLKVAARNAKKHCDRVQSIEPKIQINFELREVEWKTVTMPNDLAMLLLA